MYLLDGCNMVQHWYNCPITSAKHEPPLSVLFGAADRQRRRPAVNRQLEPGLRRSSEEWVKTSTRRCMKRHKPTIGKPSTSCQGCCHYTGDFSIGPSPSHLQTTCDFGNIPIPGRVVWSHNARQGRPRCTAQNRGNTSHRKADYSMKVLLARTVNQYMSSFESVFNPRSKKSNAERHEVH